MLVEDLMVHECDLEFLSPDMTLREAAKKMLETKRPHGASVKGMLVKEYEKVAGILSIKDILDALSTDYGDEQLSDFAWDGMLIDAAKSEKIRNKKVSECMTKDVKSVTPKTPLKKCSDIMRKEGLQRMPVMENGNLEGMIYIRDIAEIALLNLAN
ncbi:MAG: CBS domain-containing protein [Candidatus Moranbacteria bacterium]|nr:CBS domain-containing protein [Candidatus Moranbacteria bacterium]